MSDTLTRPVETETDFGTDILDIVAPYEENNDPNHKTHIVNPPGNLHLWREGMSAQDVVNLARMRKIEIVALCGYRWIPMHNPEKFDVCDSCMREAGNLMRGAGE